MKITFLLSSLWLSGGVRVVVEYANRLSLRGHQIYLVYPKGAISKEIEQEISPVLHILEANFPLAGTMAAWGKIRLTLAMAKAAPKCDVVISTHTPTTLVTLLACGLAKKGVPVWFYMDYPGMFENRPVETWLLRNAARWHRAALVLSGHSLEEIKAFTRIEVTSVGLGISHLDELFAARGSRKVDNGKKAILYLGDFRPRKGLQDFLSATELVFRQRDDIELWIAVKEPGEIKSSVPVCLFLRPSVNELAELYAQCDLFVSSSWYEGFGLPPLEAMACGAPVVTTDSGGVRDYARNNENCLVVPTRNPEKLSDAIQTVLNSPDLAAKISKNGQKTAEEYTWEKATDRFENALLTIVRSRSV